MYAVYYYHYDCVAFVKSVYAKAGLPQPLFGARGSYVGCPQGIGGNMSGSGYQYCKGFSETYNPAPGDIISWNGHVAIYMGNGLVSEGGSGFSGCQLNVSPWLPLSNAKSSLTYTGGN
ncbi:NlpC/P60 family protein [Ruminococcaceae bacterium OttesenSCG-928-A11]|nr:NlpC/P60 family protein [Ruminococcaceae bacterium OttesenSCG-928-A11]